jgi:hypothetical protein
MQSPSLIERFRRVPALLRIAVAASLAIGIAFPFSTFFGGFNYNGVAMSPEELWATGTAWAVLAASPLMLITGFGILYARPWVRPVLVALSFLQYLPFQIAHWLFGAPNPVSSTTFYLVSCVSWALLTVAYLSWWAPAKRFFQTQTRIEANP